MPERVVGALPRGDLAVELEQPPVRLVDVVGDRARPAVRRGDGLVELSVQVGEVRVGALVDLVVELRQPDLALDADLLTSTNDPAAKSRDLIPLSGTDRIGPRECVEGGDRVSRAGLELCRLRGCPTMVQV